MWTVPVSEPSSALRFRPSIPPCIPSAKRKQSLFRQAQHRPDHTDLDKLAESKEVDAVYIANPNAFHCCHSKRLLGGGKHVICEKTSVVTSEQLKSSMRPRCIVIFMEAMKGLYRFRDPRPDRSL